MTDLLECRKEIDVIDKEILRSLRRCCRIQDPYRKKGSGSKTRAGQNRSPERICSWGIQ